MAISGYAGSILFVDLTSARITRETLDAGWVRDLIGGYGINNKLAYELMPKEVGPLSPENLIIIGAGPFAGTLVPGAAKILATTRFPINGAFATAAGGGSFAQMLKSAGYDHVVISGRSPRPVYLRIAEDKIGLLDAAELWGRDTFETTDYLRHRYEPCSVIPIGQAGENQVKISITAVDKAGTLGRGGLPAVMGAKNLKAIVVQQGTKEVRIAHRLNLQKLVNNLHERMMKWPGRQYIIDNGLMRMPQDIAELHQKTRRPLACTSCPLADKEMIRLTEGPYAGLQTYMPHMTVHRFTADTSTRVYEQSIKYTDTLNRYGLCHMNFTSLFYLVVRLFREGIITGEDTGGIEIKDDIDTALILAKLTAQRQGFGAVLAEGLLGATQRFGHGVEKYIEHIKGHSIVYDPRLRRLGTMEFEQITTPRGAHVSAAGSPSYEPGRPPADFARHGERMGIPPEAIKRTVTETSFNPGRFSRYSEDWYSLFNCLSLCNRAQVNRFYHVQTIAELYRAVTGIDHTPPEMMKIAERAWTIGKLLNVREGFSRKDDKAPEAWFEPLVRDGQKHQMTDYYGTATLTPKDMEDLLDDYYDERGYNRQTGLPTLARLKELGLEKMAAGLNLPG